VYFLGQHPPDSIAIDFAARIVRDVVDNKPFLRNGFAAQPLTAPDPERFGGRIAVVDKPNGDRNGFAADRISYRESTSLGNSRMGFEQAVDLGGLHFESGAVDFILDPAGQADLAVASTTPRSPV
jgi:hypothetical protein